MKNNFTPHQAYEKVNKIATKKGLSISNYAEKCGVSRSAISRWKNKINGTVTVAMLEKLGIKI